MGRACASGYQNPLFALYRHLLETVARPTAQAAISDPDTVRGPSLPPCPTVTPQARNALGHCVGF